MKTKLETVFFVVLIAKVHTACNDTQAVYIVPGDVYFSGIFNGHSGENCSTPVPHGMQQMAAAIAITKALQDISFIPGIKFGISLYEGCSSPMMAQKAAISATVEDECMASVSLGILTSSDIYKSLRELAGSLSLSIVTTSSPYNIPFMFNITASLLLNLEWNELDYVLANDSLLLDSFEEVATNNLLCIHEKNLLSLDREIIMNGTVIILADRIDLEKMLNRKVITISANAKLLFLALDGNLMTLSDSLPAESYIILPSYVNNMYEFIPDFNMSSDNTTSFGSELLLTNEVQSPLFLQMATSILQIATLFKSNLAVNCPLALKGEGLCSDFVVPENKVITKSALSSPILSKVLLKLLKIEQVDYEIFKVVKKNLDEDSGYRDFGNYKLNEKQWMLYLQSENSSKIQQCRYDPNDNRTGVDCSHCSNFAVVYGKKYAEMHERETMWDAIEWKSEAWVAAILTISAVGILCVLAVSTFIIVRICKQDILEGNPTFTFLMLVSIVFMYISCLPFAFVVHDSYQYYLELFCNLRIYGTSLSYSLIFSLMLARCFMIASCDQDGGFMSHINGYLQTVICFFIVAVQIALSIQFGALNLKFLSTDQCISMTKGYLFISILSYNILLLILLIFTTPFVMKSKRNYHEGSFFAAATFLCLLAWSGWITAFFLLPEKWHDMITTCGLCSTATIIVVTVFIPRTYLMMTGIVRDHLASNLPSLAYASSNSVIDVNYRSTQALYDSVHPISLNKGLLNPNFYSDRPNTPSTSKMDSIQRPEHRTSDNTYERYDTPTSPLNVTRF